MINWQFNVQIKQVTIPTIFPHKKGFSFFADFSKQQKSANLLLIFKDKDTINWKLSLISVLKLRNSSQYFLATIHFSLNYTFYSNFTKNTSGFQTFWLAALLKRLETFRGTSSMLKNLK
jgi:hypothetical protein